MDRIRSTSTTTVSSDHSSSSKPSVAYTTTREDGVTVITYSPSDMVKSLPTYGDWKTVLKARPDHATVTPLGNVLFTCLACGEYFPSEQLPSGNITGTHGKKVTSEAWNIRIGGLIKFPEEKWLNSKTLEVRTKVIPVSSTGFGCQTCLALYAEEVGKANEENTLREQLATAQARLNIIHERDRWDALTPDERKFVVGKPKTIKLPTAIQPWVDVFALLARLGKDGV